MHIDSISMELPILYFKGKNLIVMHFCCEDLILSLQTVWHFIRFFTVLSKYQSAGI